MSETPPPRLPTAIAGDNHDARRRSGPPSLDDLPNELFVEIFSYFSAASTLEPRFRDDASTIMDDYLAARGSSPYHHLHHHRHSNDSQTRTPLKAISLVCRRWRDVILPCLFRHVLWTFRRLEQPPASGGGEPDDDVERLELLAFLRRNRLGDAVKGITLHVPCPEHLIDDPTELVGRWGLVPDSTAAALISPKDEEGGGQDEDDVGVVLSDSVSLVLADVNGHATWANTWFWALLFRVVTDPLRVSLLAAPVVLATMISRKVFTRCQPQLMTRYHLLSVSRPPPGCQLDHPPPPHPGVRQPALRAVRPPATVDRAARQRGLLRVHLQDRRLRRHPALAAAQPPRLARPGHPPRLSLRRPAASRVRRRRAHGHPRAGRADLARTRAPAPGGAVRAADASPPGQQRRRPARRAGQGGRARGARHGVFGAVPGHLRARPAAGVAVAVRVRDGRRRGRRARVGGGGRDGARERLRVGGGRPGKVRA
ncbi:hypothetical protein ISF_04895 [Cordyceps fumosorosea ARSEF 2679]|uniref:Uncharacterized protein n=1 Tax=Cordyceps fumosorosea (strain ARSEF 2679) TaxID=1081104 RepID=A0A167VVB3_CORFA|nr:hypothetical protein ISF_04895 [Cordyceps fumosorosea ARSEF 2679]OAA63019.1 hypothetical protein ISF_04895 [Cordyceps fumosorosea ARSEF 2679]